MKKIVSIALVLVMLCSALVGCGKVKECELCGEEYKGKTYKGEVLGVEVEICKDCNKELKELEKEMEELLG